MIDFTNGEFAENMARVAKLITASQKLEGLSSGERELAKEVLRSAVVFLHSSLEEVIRNLYLYRLPNVSAEKLNTVPFAGHESSHRPKNIQLGDLLPYRGKFVENVIFESIDRYVDTFNLNSSTHLATCLNLANVPDEPMKKFYACLDSLMKRRHQVVHQMDRANRLDPLTEPVNDIDLSSVLSWKEAVEGFTRSLMNAVPTNADDT
jgi:hypothetical protein